ncbi:unnamed protein product [Symbiodinium microadriaticum]|nr:unnamed protein product [Symbiodinium microadriaticum]
MLPATLLLTLLFACRTLPPSGGAVRAPQERSASPRVRNAAVALAGVVFAALGAEALQPVLEQLRPAKQVLLKSKFQELEDDQQPPEDVDGEDGEARPDLDGFLICSAAERRVAVKRHIARNPGAPNSHGINRCRHRHGEQVVKPGREPCPVVLSTMMMMIIIIIISTIIIIILSSVDTNRFGLEDRIPPEFGHEVANFGNRTPWALASARKPRSTNTLPILMTSHCRQLSDIASEGILQEHSKVSVDSPSGIKMTCLPVECAAQTGNSLQRMSRADDDSSLAIEALLICINPYHLAGQPTVQACLGQTCKSLRAAIAQPGYGHACLEHFADASPWAA